MLPPAATGAAAQAAIVVAAALDEGHSWTVPPSRVPFVRFLIAWDVTVITPVADVLTKATYLELPPAVDDSQPQPSAAGKEPEPDWTISVIDVRHCDAAKMTSDILARTV